MAHDEEEGEETRMRKKEDAKETIVFEHVFFFERSDEKWRKMDENGAAGEEKEF